MKTTPRTQADILTDIKRIQRKRAVNWIAPQRCASPALEMLHARQLDDLKHELKSLENTERTGASASGDADRSKN